jgi:hypothetical protein
MEPYMIRMMLILAALGLAVVALVVIAAWKRARRGPPAR